MSRLLMLFEAAGRVRAASRGPHSLRLLWASVDDSASIEREVRVNDDEGEDVVLARS